jgi:hypothetical protein
MTHRARRVIARHEWGAVCAAAAQLADNCGVIVQQIPNAAHTRVDLHALAAARYAMDLGVDAAARQRR